MKIEYSFGPHAGEVDHIPQNPLTDLLVKSGVLKLIQETAPKTIPVCNAVNTKIPNYATPQWEVCRDVNGFALITLKAGRSEFSYNGSAEGVAFHFRKAGFTCPTDIIERFVVLQRQPLAVAPSEAERNAKEDTNQFPTGGTWFPPEKD
jgi:hypothetical protein